MESQLSIEMKGIKFSASGSSEWVDAKYSAFLNDLSSVGQGKAAATALGAAADMTDTDVGPLAIFLKDSVVGANQNNRFLATAIWLKRQGQKIITTAIVVKSLAEAQQQRLGNPADVLNKNVKKGFCVKSGEGFYVTPEGEESLKRA